MIKQCEVHRGPLNHTSEAEDKGKTTWEKINKKNEQIIIKKQFIHLHPNRSSCHLPPENYLWTEQTYNKHKCEVITNS